MISFVSALSVIENEEGRARAGNIFDRYQNAMYWTAHDILKNRSDAEDAVMEAARSICKNYSDFKPLTGKDLKFKVLAVVRNAAIDIYRRNQRKSTQSLDERFTDNEDGDIPEDTVLMFDTADLGDLQKHIFKLKEQYKVVLILRYVNEMSVNEIARIQNKPASTISTQIIRAKAQLKKMLEEEKAHEKQ